jgi:hypothetical protein
MRWAVAVSLLLISRAAMAQQPAPCRPTSIGFACPGDLICNTELLQCLPRTPPVLRCEPSQGALACPGDLMCDGSHRCVPRPHHPHAEAMRNSGMVLTIAGTGMLVFAINFLAGGFHDCGFMDENCTAGARLLFGSFALFGVGIPFWAVGQAWLDRYPERAELFITPVEGGAVAGVRLVSF